MNATFVIDQNHFVKHAHLYAGIIMVICAVILFRYLRR